jgi:hypothetical protein
MEFKSLETEEEKGVWESFYNIPEHPILTQAHQYICYLLLFTPSFDVNYCPLCPG